MRASDATPSGNAVQFIDTAGCGFDEDKERNRQYLQSR